MASTYSNLKLQLMATGENTGTWGNVTNVNLGTAIEEMVANTATVTFASGDVTLSLTDTNASQTARNMRLNLSGTTGGARNLNVPAVQKVWIVYNACADAVTVKTSGGTGIVVPAGKSMWLYGDGTNVVEVVTHLGTATVTNLNVTNLTLTSFTATNITVTTLNATTVNSGTIIAGTPIGVASGGTGVATISGIIKGAGTGAFSAATAGTDYVAPGTATNFTAKQTFTGAATTMASKFVNALEKVTVSATAATGTIAYDITTQSNLYYTSNAAGNWTVNFRGDGSNSLDSLMATGESVTVSFWVTQGGTAYYNTTVQVDGTAVGVTTKWLGGAPTTGVISSVNVYTYCITKTGAATFTVLATMVSFS
jgi:hypothetical protein